MRLAGRQLARNVLRPGGAMRSFQRTTPPVASMPFWGTQVKGSVFPGVWERRRFLGTPQRLLSQGSAPSNPGEPPMEDQIFEVLQENFVQVVLQSEEPVIVNCFADFCKDQLGPMANAVSGTPGIKFAVMNMETCPEFAQQLQVRNLPTTFLFHKGKAVDMGGGQYRLVGSLAPEAIVALVKKAQELSGVKGQSANELLIEAGKLLSANKVQQALQVYMHVSQISKEQHGAQAYAGMALCALAVRDTEAAEDLVQTIKKEFPKSLEDPIVKQACNAVELTKNAVAPEVLEKLQNNVKKDANDHQSRHDLALAFFGMQQYADAMSQALEIIKRDKKWEDGKAKAMLFKFFETLGNEHPDVIAARKRLASYLF